MSLPDFVYGVSAFVGALALCLVGLAFFLGYRKVGSTRRWRCIKLVSNFAGLVGIGLLLMNFEATLRQGFSGGPTMDAVLTFIEAKTQVLEEMAVTCGDQARTNAERLCADLRHMHRLQHYTSVRDGKPLPLLREDQYSSEARPFLKRLNAAIEQVNLFAKRPEDQWELVSREGKSKLLLGAALFLALAVAGSIGEAAFQLRIAKDDE